MRTFLAQYRALLAGQLSRARVAVLAGLAVLVGVLAFAVGRAADTDPDAPAVFVNGLGLALLVPLIALYFGSAAFGDLRADATLVYLWLRPRPRLELALAALAVAATVAIPAGCLLVVLMAAIADPGDLGLLAGAVVATVMSALAYCALFTLLGLVARRALIWGLGYVLIWEGLAPAFGDNAAHLAVRVYARSILEHAAGEFENAGPKVGATTSLLVLTAIAVIAAGVTAWRLSATTIE